MKTKKQKVNAQTVKKALIEAAKKIGKRKQMTVGQLFELVCECAAT